MKKINVGIDLGTTYSAVAWYSKMTNRVEILKNSSGSETTPSVVWIENGKVIIGEEAKEQQRSGNLNTAAFYKSKMADPNYRAFIDNKEYTAEDLSTFFLQEMIKDIEITNDVKVDNVVITVPADFNNFQKEATIRAGQRAGLNVVKIINEPTAAIIAYGLTSGSEKNVLVYDLGGGTFDVTIAHIKDTKVDVIASKGNHQLGGRDWDKAILEEVIKNFYEEHGIDIKNNLADLYELQVKCEEAKKRLSSVSSVIIAAQSEGYSGRYQITCENFEYNTAAMLNETEMLINHCFKEIEEKIGKPFGWSNIDEVVLVGGSTRMNQVSKMIISEYGKPPLTKDINVDTIVAVGAAQQVELSTEGKITLTVKNQGQKSTNVVVLEQHIKDTTSHSLGMIALTEKTNKYVNSIIIKRNSYINEEYGRKYHFKGEKLEVYVLQGESIEPEYNNIIGKYIITGMNPQIKNEITVNFLYNKNGIVEVNAKLSDNTILSAQREMVTETVEEIITRLEEARNKRSQIKPVDIYLIIDTSGSMSNRITQAKSAAKEFVNQIDFNNTKLTIAHFNNEVFPVCSNSKNRNDIMKAIDSMVVNGGTAGCPISYYKNSFAPNTQSVMVILTDGQWWNAKSEAAAAEEVKNAGVIIYGVGIDAADKKFLDQISSFKGKKVDINELSKTFAEIATSIATEIQN